MFFETFSKVNEASNSRPDYDLRTFGKLDSNKFRIYNVKSNDRLRFFISNLPFHASDDGYYQY